MRCRTADPERMTVVVTPSRVMLNRCSLAAIVVRLSDGGDVSIGLFVKLGNPMALNNALLDDAQLALA